MNSRQTNSMLWTAAAMLAMGAVTCAALTILWPLKHVANADADVTTSPSTRPTPLPPLESLQAAANVPLRRAASVATTQPITANSAAAPTSPPFTLAGTIGTSLALLRTPAGQIELKAVGEEAMGAKVLAIRPSQVDVRFNGQSVTLQKPKETGSPG